MTLDRPPTIEATISALREQALRGELLGEVTRQALELATTALDLDVVTIVRPADADADVRAGHTRRRPLPDAGAVDPDALLRERGLAGGAAVPIEGRDRPHGVLLAGKRTPRELAPAELDLLRDVAQVIGTAVAVERMQELAERLRGARERQVELVAELERVTAALGDTASEEVVARAFIEHGRSVLGATTGGVVTVGDDGMGHIVAVTGLPAGAWPLAPVPVVRGSPHGDVILDDRPICLETREAYAERYPVVAAGTTSKAVAFVPLHAKGRPIGLVGWGFAEERTFTDADLDVMTRLGDHAGAALDRARRHRTEQPQAASVKRVEALAEAAGGIAHEFNNLLGVILNYATLVDRVLPPGDPAHEDLAEIRRAADRATALTRQLQTVVHEGEEGASKSPQS